MAWKHDMFVLDVVAVNKNKIRTRLGTLLPGAYSSFHVMSHLILH